MMLIRTRWFQLSRRGAVLVLFGAAFILLGYSYLSIPAESVPLVKHSLHAALSIAPLQVYGWGWVVCGAVALLGGLVHRLDWLGFGVAVFMPTAWSVAYFSAEWIDGTPRAWVSGVVFGLIAAALGIVGGMADPLDTGPRRRRGWR